MSPNPLFVTIATAEGEAAVRLMIDSLRRFGGELSGAPVWVFAPDPGPLPRLEDADTRRFPLELPSEMPAYPFGRKVTACARAEQLAPPGTGSLVWIDPSALVAQPPELYVLGPEMDAAFRPVHIRNVGLPPSEPLDAYWRGIYSALGVDDIATTITSFVDGQLLRTYFNSHTFAINPGLGLMRRWADLFWSLVSDGNFQSNACADEDHQIFLFQACLSALIATALDPTRVRLLPPTYNYPYHLQDRIPPDRKMAALNEAVIFTYEDLSIHPKAIAGIEAREPLRSWLEARAGQS
jgi:hypothetical protein